MYKNRLKTGNKCGDFFIGGVLRGNGWTGNERGAKRGLHSAFLRCCKLLIFRVYFTGAGIYIDIRAPCTCPMDCLFNGGVCGVLRVKLWLFGRNVLSSWKPKINICCADMKTNKAEIYKNAFRLFLQDNYEKVTVVKLEKAIGLSCRGIYHHTKDKLGLFKAVVDTYIFEPHKVENKFVFAEDISLRDFLQTYIEGVERTMDYLSNELGVDRKECAKCYFQFLFQAYKYYPNFVERMDAIFEKDQQMWRKIIDKAIASGEIRNDIATEEVVDMFRMAHLGMSYVLAFTTGLDTERLKRQFDAVYKLLK